MSKATAMYRPRYNDIISINMPGFTDAVRYYVRRMRMTNFVSAYHDLRGKHGIDLAFEVGEYCLYHSITMRSNCGRLFLCEGYEKRVP